MEEFLSGGVTIRLSVTEPVQRGDERWPAILLLHGAGGNVGFWMDRIAPQVARLGIAAYAVHYFDRTGTVRADPATILDGKHVPLWMGTARDALAQVAQRPQVDPERIALLGVSLGAYLSLGLATLPFRPAIRAIVEISGGLAPGYEDRVTEMFPPTLILHGDQDAVVPVSEAHKVWAVLERCGVSTRMEILAGEGHWFSGAAQGRILGMIGSFLGEAFGVQE